MDTLDPSPNHNSRNNRENNSASSQQQKRQRSQSSNTATTSSKRTSGRHKKNMKEKDRNQTTCDTWLTKSTKQGAVFDFDHNDEEYEFDGSYENSSSKSSSALFDYFATQVVYHRSLSPIFIFASTHEHDRANDCSQKNETLDFVVVVPVALGVACASKDQRGRKPTKSLLLTVVTKVMTPRLLRHRTVLRYVFCLSLGVATIDFCIQTNRRCNTMSALSSKSSIKSLRVANEQLAMSHPLMQCASPSGLKSSRRSVH